MGDPLIRWWPVNAHHPPEFITLADGRRGVFVQEDTIPLVTLPINPEKLPQTTETPSCITITV